MTDIKMSDAFDLPASGGDFTLVALKEKGECTPQIR